MTDKNPDIENIVEHWITTSDRDYETMKHLYDSRDYHWALFMGHLLIEKLLKATVVKKTQNHAPLTHDLRRLARLSELEINDEQKVWLNTLTTFNLNARYDSYKQAFYRKCDQEYADEWISIINELRTWIKMRL